MSITSSPGGWGLKLAFVHSRQALYLLSDTPAFIQQFFLLDLNDGRPSFLWVIWSKPSLGLFLKPCLLVPKSFPLWNVLYFLLLAQTLSSQRLPIIFGGNPLLRNPQLCTAKYIYIQCPHDASLVMFSFPAP